MPYAVKGGELAEFQRLLIGTWTNDDELAVVEKSEKGPKKRPLSYNVMPLPQIEKQPGRKNPQSGKYGGFILKNFSFTETIRFNGTAGRKDPASLQDPEAVAVVAGAPNRGGWYTQFAHSVFYEQQVRFSEGPKAGKIVHLENGAWLHLGSTHQNIGPYEGKKAKKGTLLRQQPYVTIAKQIAVPHGNSVLALGSIDLNDRDRFEDEPDNLHATTVFPGAPVIPDQFVPYPEPADIATAPFYDPYEKLLDKEKDFENPKPDWTLNPNYPLQVAVDKIDPAAHMHWRVTTLPIFGEGGGGDGSVTNIPFEERKSEVTEYWADYWLLSKDPRARKSKRYARKFDYLLYNQTILMKMPISTDGGKTFEHYVFPHVTSNVVKKVPGTPTQARHATKTPLE
jgi:hypothetical protein